MSVRPCKPCNQTTGRNFEPKFMKFGTQHFFGPGTKPIEIGYDRSIISPSPHTKDLPEKDFNDHKSLRFGTCKFHISLNLCA